MRLHSFISAAAFTLATATSAHVYASENTTSQNFPSNIQALSTADGTLLTDNEGMTLYTFDKDKEGQSNCYGKCAEKWPPLISASALNNGKFTTVKRKDGSFHTRYNNAPLYLWVGDKKAGETTGDGIKGVWHKVTL